MNAGGRRLVRRGGAAIGKLWNAVAGAVIVLVGMAVVAVGVFEIHRPSGLIVAGCELIAIGWLIDRLGVDDGDSN